VKGLNERITEINQTHANDLALIAEKHKIELKRQSDHHAEEKI